MEPTPVKEITEQELESHLPKEKHNEFWEELTKLRGVSSTKSIEPKAVWKLLNTWVTAEKASSIWKGLNQPIDFSN